MDDIDHRVPALFQLRKLRDWPHWSCEAYPPSLRQVGLVYTPEFGKRHPRWAWLRYVEMLTQGPVWQIPLFWVPCLTAMSVYIGLYSQWKLLHLFAGLLSWTLAEYVIHRFVFHNAILYRYVPEVVFALHFVHHKQPQDFQRLTAPLLMSLPIGFMIWTSVGTFFDGMYNSLTLNWILGFGIGYVMYDFLHYASHKWRPTWKLQFHHLAHHNLCHRKYGFTSAVWDYVFSSN